MKGMALFGGNKKFKFGRRKKSKEENVITPTHETTHTSYTPGPLSKAVSDGGGYTNIGTRITSSGIKDMGGAGVLRPTSTSTSSTSTEKSFTTGYDDLKSFTAETKALNQGNKSNPNDMGGDGVRSPKAKKEAKVKASNAALHARLTKIFETDETGKFKDQTAVDKHMATVVPKGYTKKVIDKGAGGGGGSREIYTPKPKDMEGAGVIKPKDTSLSGAISSGGGYTNIGTDTRENATNQDMFNKANNNKSVTENYNPSEAIITQGNVVSDELKSYHEAQLEKAANKPKPVVEDTSQAALEKKYGLGSGQASSKMAAKNKSISTGKSSSGAEADISSVISDIKGLSGKKDYFKK